MKSFRDLHIIERTTAFALRAWGFRSEWIETPEGLVHMLLREGTRPAPPLVMLHGLVASGGDYFPVLRRLANLGYTVFAPDLPGHGLSPVPAQGMRSGVLLEAVDDALAKKLKVPAVLFGNSMGGFAAVRLAAQHPDRIAGLVLASPGGAPLPEPAFSRFLERFRIASQADAQRFLHDVQGRPAVVPGFVAYTVWERFSRPEIRELLAGIEPRDLLAPEELSQLTMPILVLWGRKERILPPVQREFFRWHLPDHATFEEPPDLGHAPFLDDPDLIVNRIGDFMARL